MKVYGLTGGIGMGKSTSDRLLGEMGIAVVDTDHIARTLVEPGQPALAEIKGVFGLEVFFPDGTLDRSKLGAIVFSDAVARGRLEKILHPRIRQVWSGQIASWKADGKSSAVVVIPLLFETEAQSQFDEIICVACSASTQATRLGARGLTPEQIKQRFAAQWPIEKKLALSQRAVWTEGDLATHRAQLERIFG